MKKPETKVFTFKAPIELDEALRRVVFEKKFESDSDFMRTKIMNDPAIKAELKRIKDERNKVQKVSTA